MRGHNQYGVHLTVFPFHCLEMFLHFQNMPRAAVFLKSWKCSIPWREVWKHSRMGSSWFFFYIIYCPSVNGNWPLFFGAEILIFQSPFTFIVRMVWWWVVGGLTSDQKSPSIFLQFQICWQVSYEIIKYRALLNLPSQKYPFLCT